MSDEPNAEPTLAERAVQRVLKDQTEDPKWDIPPGDPRAKEKYLDKNGTWRTVGSRWKKGVSGNPMGRKPTPKITRLVEAILKEDPTIGVAIAENFIENTRKGNDVQWMRLFLDRMEGPVGQQVNITSEQEVVKVVDLSREPDEEEPNHEQIEAPES